MRLFLKQPVTWDLGKLKELTNIPWPNVKGAPSIVQNNKLTHHVLPEIADVCEPLETKMYKDRSGMNQMLPKPIQQSKGSDKWRCSFMMKQGNYIYKQNVSRVGLGVGLLQIRNEVNCLQDVAPHKTIFRPINLQVKPVKCREKIQQHKEKHWDSTWIREGSSLMFVR